MKQTYQLQVRIGADKNWRRSEYNPAGRDGFDCEEDAHAAKQQAIADSHGDGICQYRIIHRNLKEKFPSL